MYEPGLFYFQDQPNMLLLFLAVIAMNAGFCLAFGILMIIDMEDTQYHVYHIAAFFVFGIVYWFFVECMKRCRLMVS